MLVCFIIFDLKTTTPALRNKITNIHQTDPQAKDNNLWITQSFVPCRDHTAIEHSRKWQMTA